MTEQFEHLDLSGWGRRGVEIAFLEPIGSVRDTVEFFFIRGRGGGVEFCVDWVGWAKYIPLFDWGGPKFTFTGRISYFSAQFRGRIPGLRCRLSGLESCALTLLGMAFFANSRKISLVALIEVSPKPEPLIGHDETFWFHHGRFATSNNGCSFLTPSTKIPQWSHTPVIPSFL